MVKEIKKFNYMSICGQSEMANGMHNGLSQSWWKGSTQKGMMVNMRRDETSTERNDVRHGVRTVFNYWSSHQGNPFNKFLKDE